MDVGAAVDQPLHDGEVATFGGEIERRRSRKVACVDRRTALKEKVDHVEVAGSCGVAERPRAEPVSRVDRRALIEQSGGEVDAIRIWAENRVSDTSIEVSWACPVSYLRLSRRHLAGS